MEQYRLVPMSNRDQIPGVNARVSQLLLTLAVDF